jgi:cation transporter-like permease
VIDKITPNAALLIDAAGCFAGACLFLISTTAWGWTDLPESWRLPVTAALFVFSVLLVVIARYRSRPLVALAVLGNMAWIAGGAIALFVTGTVLGTVLTALVMLAVAGLAWLQARGLYDPDSLSSPRAPTFLSH